MRAMHVTRTRSASRIAGCRFLNAALVGMLMFALSGATSDAEAKPKSAARLPTASAQLANVTFVVFDLETTGFSQQYDRVVELGAVKFRDGKVIDQKSWLVNPGRRIPWMATQVHGISGEMVKDAPDFATVYPEFLDFIQGAVLMAHNAKFDVGFIAVEIKRAGFPLPPNKTVDSLSLFRRWYPNAKSHSLEEVVRHVEIKPGAFHRGLDDSLYVFQIFEKYVRESGSLQTLGDVYKAAGGPMKF